jgi:hypothetical protein
VKRWQRRLLNRLSGLLQDASEWCAAKAERRRRPRPLVFPSALQLMMDDMINRSAALMAERVVDEILHGPRLIKVRDE